MTLVNGWAIYQAPAGSHESGSFRYTVRDGLGGVVSGTVTVTATANPPATVTVEQFERSADGTVTIVLRGLLPNRAYKVAYTDQLQPPNTVWNFLFVVQSDAQGQIAFQDTATAAARFYGTALD